MSRYVGTSIFSGLFECMTKTDVNVIVHVFTV